MSSLQGWLANALDERYEPELTAVLISEFAGWLQSPDGQHAIWQGLLAGENGKRMVENITEALVAAAKSGLPGS